METTFQTELAFQESFHKRSGRRDQERKRVNRTDPGAASYLGPWGGFEDETLGEKRQKAEQDLVDSQRPSDIIGDSLKESDVRQLIPPSSIFHGEVEEGWSIPSATTYPDIGSVGAACQLPGKLVHTWVGHRLGIQAIKLYPITGHLLLSASLDSTIKIWNCIGGKECRMTYTGHSQAVRDVAFAFSGEKFYSVGFDTNVRLWDTETGKIVTSFSNNKLNYCIAVHPKDGNSFIVGNENRSAIQYDAASGKVVQVYNEHQASVSSITFCEDGKKLVTTSDDRKIFVWNYGIPVVDKYISDPNFHSVPAVTLHPSSKFIAGQSMNNTIVVHTATGDYKRQGKRFHGHNNSGYAIQPGFSTDGKYIMSGSSDGNLFFWDWKSTKLYRNMKAHDGVCMSALWHPMHASRVITCGWDKTIKMWE